MDSTYPTYPGFNVLGVHHLGLNNLPKPAVEGLAELLGDVPQAHDGLAAGIACGFNNSSQISL